MSHIDEYGDFKAWQQAVGLSLGIDDEELGDLTSQDYPDFPDDSDDGTPTVDEPPTKVCGKCKRALPATEEYFFIDKRKRKSGKIALHSPCRDCVKEYEHSPERRERDREQHRKPAALAKQKARNQTDESKAYFKGYRQRPHVKERSRARQATPEYKAAKLESRHTPKGRAMVTTSQSRLKARRRALPAELTSSEWIAALDYFNHRCAACGRVPYLWQKLVPDHWIPLSSPDCPGTVVTNIVPLCDGHDGCNNHKGSKPPLDWLNGQFGPHEASQIAARIQAYFDTVSVKDDINQEDEHRKEIPFDIDDDEVLPFDPVSALDR